MLKVAKETGGGIDAFLGQNTSFNGTLVFEGVVRLDGNFEGNVKSNDTLVIAESGNVNAQIEAGIVKISGTHNPERLIRVHPRKKHASVYSDKCQESAYCFPPCRDIGSVKIDPAEYSRSKNNTIEIERGHLPEDWRRPLVITLAIHNIFIHKHPLLFPFSVTTGQKGL